ncbi:DUF1382 family protein, partial [Escherichia coli]|nr:DUF1382 family protein [Escherichia coli]
MHKASPVELRTSIEM